MGMFSALKERKKMNFLTTPRPEGGADSSDDEYSKFRNKDDDFANEEMNRNSPTTPSASLPPLTQRGCDFQHIWATLTCSPPPTSSDTEADKAIARKEYLEKKLAQAKSKSKAKVGLLPFSLN